MSSSSSTVESPFRPAAVTSTRFAVGSLMVLVLVNIINFYDRQVPGALAEPIRKEFGLSDSQLGLLGSAFTWLYAVVGLPLGLAADRYSRKWLLAAGVTVWGALTGCAAWARSLPLLVVSRLGVAVGEAACAPAATSWIGDLFPAEKRSRPLALFMLGVPIGGALSFFLSGPIALAHGWRTAMVMAAAPALVIVPVLLLLREPQRGASERQSTERQTSERQTPEHKTLEYKAVTTAPATGSIWQVLRIPTFLWIIASGALVNFNLYAIGTFLPAFFGRIHHMNVGRAGIVTGIVYGVGGISGGLFAGYLGDSIARRQPHGRMRAAAVASLCAVPLAYFGVQQSYGSLAMAIPLLTVAYGLLNMYYGLVYASIQDIVAPALRGTSMSIYFLVMYMGGASFGPILTGQLSDRMAHRAAAAAGSLQITEAFRAIGLQQAMLVIPVLSLGLALVLWMGSKTIARDMLNHGGTA
ncbi:MAG TPA: MFS transporter [Candidatus Saccharimonadales bacterium]|jgi:MFS family permease|nr:MFS transporter [Candidatus Saccharimonadales bacterium]